MRGVPQVICGCVLALGLSAAQQNIQSQQQEARAQAAQQQGPSSFSKDRKRDSEAAQQAADNARQNRDLAAQERMAIAAEGQWGEVRLQTIQLWASGFAGFLATGIAVAALLVSMGTGRRQLRAYVMPDSITVLHPTHDQPKPGRRRKALPEIPIGAIYLKNYGATPGLSVLHRADMQLLPPDREHELELPKELGRISEAAVAPGGIITKALVFRELTGPEIDAIRSHKMALYIHGVVRYRDAFKAKRETTFRLRYSRTWPPPVGASMTYCDQGNDAK